MTLTQQIAQFLASGIINGTIYALLGLGLVAIHSATRVVNVAQGEFAALGALLASTLVTRGMPLSLAAAVAVGVAAPVGGGGYRTAILPGRGSWRPRRRAPRPIDAGHLRHGVDLGFEGVRWRCDRGHGQLPLDSCGVHAVRCRRVAWGRVDLLELSRRHRVRGADRRAAVARAGGAPGWTDHQRGSRARMTTTRRLRLAATAVLAVPAGPSFPPARP